MKGIAQPKAISKPTLKRKVGYSDEEVSFTRARLGELELHEEVQEDGDRSGHGGLD